MNEIPPTDQVLKNLFDDRTLVDEADDVHFAGALGADKRICFVHLSDEVIERALDRDRQLLRAYPVLIKVYRRLGKTDRLQTLEAAYRQALIHAEAQHHFARGVRLHFEGRYPEAIRALQQSIRASPRNPAALSNLGLIYFDSA